MLEKFAKLEGRDGSNSSCEKLWIYGKIHEVHTIPFLFKSR